MVGKIKKMPKVRISTYRASAVKRGRVHRFSKWAGDTYGMPWRSMYEKLRRNRIKTWEGAGIIRCMSEYGFHGNPGELWDKCKRNQFCDFMFAKQMSRNTVWKRFSANDFSELELNGIQATYKRWREEIDTNEP